MCVCVCVLGVFFFFFFWGGGGCRGERGFSTIDQSLTERRLKGGQEKKERIKEKRFDAC